VKKWFKFGFSALLIVILMFSIAACNGTDKTDTEKIEKVRLVEVTRSIFYAPEYVAIAKGFFEEEGLDVELSTAFGGDKTMTALLSGGADIALVGSEIRMTLSLILRN
jgi:NitT/TauT family transport system substrate-binding protein